MLGGLGTRKLESHHSSPPHTQENNLQDSLHIDPSDLKSSTAAIRSRILSAPFPATLREEVSARLSQTPFSDNFVAVRSSGTDEDSAAHSFAGIQCKSFVSLEGCMIYLSPPFI